MPDDEENKEDTEHIESEVEHLQDDIEDVREDQKDYATKSDLEVIRSEFKKLSESKSSKQKDEKPDEGLEGESEQVPVGEVQKIDVKTEMPEPSYREVRVRIHGRYRTVKVAE